MKLDLELLRASTSAMIFEAGKPDVKDVPLLEALKKHKNTIDAMMEEQKLQSARLKRS